MQLDEIGKLIVGKFSAEVEAYNAQVEKSKAVASLEDFEQHFLNTAPELEEYNAEIETLESQLESLKIKRLAAGTPLVQPAYEAALAETGVNLTALDENLKKLRTTFKYITSMYDEDSIKDVPEIAKRKGATSGGSSSGEGGRRIRGWNVFVDGKLSGAKNADGEFRSTFSFGAKDAGVETSVLQTAFFEAAGTTELDKITDTTIEFVVNEHNIKCEKIAE